MKSYSELYKTNAKKERKKGLLKYILTVNYKVKTYHSISAFREKSLKSYKSAL
jgi:hypothetical protein